MILRNFLERDIPITDYHRELAHEYLTKRIVWFDCTDTQSYRFLLREVGLWVTLRFADDYDFCDFMREITVLRGGNPFRLRFHSDYMRHNYRTVFKFMKPRNFVRKHRPLMYRAAHAFLKRRLQ